MTHPVKSTDGQVAHFGGLDIAKTGSVKATNRKSVKRKREIYESENAVTHTTERGVGTVGKLRRGNR